MRYIVIENGTNIIRNEVELEPDNNWPVPENCFIVASDTLSIGDTYIDVSDNQPSE